MPSFAIGAVINLTLDADDSYTFSGIADMTITSSQGAQTVHLDGTQTLGPYRAATTLQIKTTTAGSYDRLYVVNRSFTLGNLTAAEIAVVNASITSGTASFPIGTLATVDGVIWVLSGIGTAAQFSSGGGGAGGSALTAAQTTAGSTGVLGTNAAGSRLTKPDGTFLKPGLISAKGTWSAAGDSIIQRGFDSTGGIGGTPTSINWVQWAASQMGNELTPITNWAFGGTTSLDFINTYLASMVADGAAIAVVHTGVNNGNPALATGRTVAQTLADYKTILDALSPVKDAVIMSGITPAKYDTASSWKFSDFRRVNEGLAQICQNYPNAIYVELGDALVDTTSLTNDPNVNYLTDGVIHQNSWGAQRMGFLLAKQLRDKLRLLPAFNVLLAPTVFTPAGTGTQTASSGVTYAGDAPYGNMVVAGSGSGTTFTGTKLTTTAGDPRYRVASPAIAASGTLVFSNSAANSGAIAAQFATGDTVRPWWEFGVISQTGMNRLQCTLAINGTRRSSGLYLSQFDPVATAKWPNDMWVGRFWGNPYTLGATPTSMDLSLAAFWGTSGGACQIEVVNFGCEKVSRA